MVRMPLHIQNRRRRRPAARGIRKAYLWLLFSLLLVSLLFCFIDAHIFPVVRALAGNRAQSVAVQSVNDAVGRVITSDAVTFSTLMNVERDGDGHVTSIQSNTLAMNRIKYDITREVLARLASPQSAELRLPVGSIFGGVLFNNRGPRLRISIQPAGAVSADFSSVFTSSGINQTHQQIMLTVHANILVIIAGQTFIQSAESSMCIADNVIVGDVPGYYGSTLPNNSPSAAGSASSK